MCNTTTTEHWGDGHGADKDDGDMWARVKPRATTTTKRMSTLSAVPTTTTSTALSCPPLSLVVLTVVLLSTLNCSCSYPVDALSTTPPNDNNFAMHHLNQSSSSLLAASTPHQHPPQQTAPETEHGHGRSKRDAYARVDQDGNTVSLRETNSMTSGRKPQDRHSNLSNDKKSKKKRCRRAVKICGRMFVRASKLLDFHLGNTTTDYRKQHCVLREAFFDCIKKQPDSDECAANKSAKRASNTRALSRFEKRLAERLWDDRFCISSNVATSA